jgi:hypothetical protein
VPQWLPEIGMIAPSDPVFAGCNVSPKRISGMLVVSRQLLLQQTGPELDQILISDSLRPISINAHCTAPGRPVISRPGSSTCPGSPNYGVIVAPATKQLLRSTPSFPGGSITTWSELRNPQSSPEITDAKAFAGCWNNLTFCLWGRGG